MHFDPSSVINFQVQINYALEGLGGFRELRTIVPIANLEDVISAFPIEPEIANWSRQAWKLGRGFAKYVGLKLCTTTKQDIFQRDVMYKDS